MKRIAALNTGVRDSENSAIAAPNDPRKISIKRPMCRCLPMYATINAPVTAPPPENVISFE